MSENSKIEWTDATWNPTRGCSRVSEGCRNCYAERVAHRFSGDGQPYAGLTIATTQGPKWTGQVTMHPELLDQPLRWRKPRRIFVDSMSDLFHKDVPFEFIDRVFAVMVLCQQHTFQVLTKRPERMLEYLKGHAAGGRHIWTAAQAIDMPIGQHKPEVSWPLQNVWIGVSVEDQGTADERIPLLQQTPAALWFISAEPLLSVIDISPYLGAARGRIWTITGGESGPGARPSHPDWFRKLRDDCAAAGVPFFFKQWGEWLPPLHDTDAINHFSAGMPPIRVGKKAAGRRLDGRTHDDFPEY